ncbi:hypothetical protein BKA93DRAFT_819110 [Sparassis latifolia]|uniref:Uncharacterized protein n=1 Tax=Sparassis crispa TaxID=139825 RepID=A0A401H118_9APHY|nr:hypothetical protein SCP_1203570 [Sparassis crispa]GBE88127.1 hypothetical protein SCP_1203570 [Sparassis crispa]
MVAYEEVTAEADITINHEGNVLKKGSLLVAMVNASEFNKLLATTEPPADRQEQLHKITVDLADFMAAIDGSGLFDYFEPDEWLANKNYGRAMIAAHWLKIHPDAVSPAVRDNLKTILHDGGAAFQEEFISVYPEAQQFV